MPVRMSEAGRDSPSWEALRPLCHIVTPIGMMGYGFDEDLIGTELTKLAQTSVPTAIILDSGSTDSGPSKLALAGMTAPRDSYKRDLTKLIRLVDAHKVPLLFSSAGGDGSNAHVDEMRAVIEEIISNGFSQWVYWQKMRRYADNRISRQFKVLSIYSEIPKDLVKKRLNQGLISGCGSAVPALTMQDIDSAPTIVAQMGCEPFLDAMFAVPDFDIIIGGRAYDPSPYVAYASYQAMGSKRIPLIGLGEQFLGGVFHMGKIMECGALCATPKSHSATATVYACGAFDITPLASDSRCTPLSVAAHTLYEKTRPDLLQGPGGCLDLTSSKYEQLSDNKSVRPNGAIFRSLPTENEKYTVKLEGACVIGYRTIFMGSFRDPILIRQLDNLLDRIQVFVGSQHKESQSTWELQFHKYGGSPDGTAEVFVVGEALADSQALANSVASSARIAATHGAYPGQKATSGNFAFGIGGKNEFEAGPCAEFCIYHLMDLETGEEGAEDMNAGSGIGRGTDNARKSLPLFTYRQDTLGTKDLNGNSSNGVAKDVRKRSVLVPTGRTPKLSPEPTGNGSSQPKKLNRHSNTNGHIIDNACETLGDVAKVLRSKNAGPYEVTLDVMFDSMPVYQAIKDSNLLDAALISRLYEISEQDIIYCGFFDQAMAFKATIPRMKGGQKSASGGYMEDDVQGSGQYLPLMNVSLPKDLVSSINSILQKTTS